MMGRFKTQEQREKKILLRKLENRDKNQFQLSSAAEQRPVKAKVNGSNPLVGANTNLRAQQKKG